MKLFSNSKFKVVTIIALLIVILVGIFVMLPKTNTSFWNKNNETVNSLNAGIKAEDVKYPAVAVGEDAVTDSDGNVIENLSIESYFLEDDGTESGKQVRGAYRYIDETATLHIKINASQFLGTISGGKIQIYGTRNDARILSVSDGDFIKNITNPSGSASTTIEFNDITGGQIITIDVVFEDNVYWTNKQAFKKNYSCDYDIKVTGSYTEDSNTRSFEKVMGISLDWDAEKELSAATLRNSLQDKGNLILTEDKELILNLSVISVTKDITRDGITTYAEYVLEGLKVNGIAPNDVSAVTLTNPSEILDLNYNSTNDKLTFKNKVIAGDGQFPKNEIISLISIKYPAELYNSVKNTIVSKDYKISVQHVAFGNEKFIYDGKSIISGTNEVGLIYTNSLDSYANVTFDKYDGEIYSFYEHLHSINKTNTKVKYADMDATAGLVEQWVIGCELGGNYTKGLLIKRNYNNPEATYKGPDMSFYNESTNTYTSFENEKYYTGVRVAENFKSLLGADGEVYVYDDETNEKILTITQAEKKYFFANEGCSKDRYKSIRIETSSVVNPGIGDIFNYVEFDNAAIAKKFTLEQFDGFSHIITGAKLYANSADLKNSTDKIGNYGSAMQNTAISNYNTGDLSYSATKDITLSTFKSNEKNYYISLGVSSYKDAYACNTFWINPKFLIEYPEEIKSVKIDSIVSNNEDISIESYEKTYIDGKIVLKIYTKGTTYNTTGITINADIETNDEYIDSNTQIETGKIRTFAYGQHPFVNDTLAFSGGYPAGNAIDIYDWNGNGKTDDGVPVYHTNLIIQSPTGIVTNTRITYTTDGTQNEVLCPDIGIITPEDAGSNATVHMKVSNYFNKSISKFKVIGKIPYKGNSYVNQDTRSLNSTFSTQMVAGGITIPAELDGKVDVYYSEKDVSITDNETYMNVSDTKYAWKKASSISDWTKVKSYLIDFKDVVLEYKDSYEFSYKVAIPTDIEYGQQTFATHAIECGINEENDLVTYSKTETNKVGLRVEPGALGRLILTKMTNEGNTLNGAEFKLTRTDGEAIEFENNEDNTYITEKTVTSNPNIELQNLYVDVQYKLEETKTPEGYETIDPILFTIKTKATGGYEFVVEGSSINGNPTIVQNKLANGKTDVLVTGASIINNVEKKYTVIYEKGTYGTFTTQTYADQKEGTTTPAFKGEKTAQAGYAFTGWIEEGTTTLVSDADIAKTKVTKDTKYVAQWEASDTKYIVEYYYEENGSYPDKANGGSVERTDTVGETVVVTEDDKKPQRDIEKYEFDSTKTESLSAVVAGDGSTVLKVYFKRMYTVTYEPGTKGTFTPQTTEKIKYNTKTPDFTGEKTAVPGYLFNGWLPEVADKVTEDATYVAQWIPNPNTKYTVEYYYQEDGKYKDTPNATDKTRTGITDTQASVKAEDKEPNSSIAPNDSKYILDDAAPNVLSGNIAGDGSLVLKVYFKEQFTIIYEPGTQGTFTTQTNQNQSYGDNTPAFKGIPQGKPGYEFTGWDKEIPNTVTQDATYVAQWKAGKVNYLVEYYYEENGKYPDKANGGNTQRTDTVGETVVVTEDDKKPQRDIEKYEFDSTKTESLSAVLAGDGSTVLKVYFKCMYTVTYEPGTKGTFTPQITEKIKYNTNTPEFTGEKTGVPGYLFNGWSPEVADKVTKDATYVAQWIPNPNTKYTVEYYYQEDGKYKDTPNATDKTRTGTTDTTATVEPEDKEPNSSVAPNDSEYIFDDAAPNVLSGNIAGDGSLVLKVYFKEQFVITYKPGTKGTFVPQEYPDQSYGNNTPAFQGIPLGKPGYNFTGWDKEIPDVVTESATYTAQWEPRTDTKYKVEYYYEENGKYPATANGGFVVREGTTDTTATVKPEDKNPTRTDSNYIYDTKAPNVESGNIHGDGSLVLKVYFKEIPVNYDIDVTLKDTKENILTENKFAITKINSAKKETILWDSKALKDGNEVEERRILIDTYTYEIRELQAPNKNYVNILNGKYIKITAPVSSNGDVSIQEWKVYNNDGTVVANTDPIYDYIQVNLSTPQNAYRKINVVVINPVTFTVEVEKIDTDGEALANTGIEINSEVIDNQNAFHKNEIEKEAVTDITTSGKVTGTTNDEGKVKYDETWVDANENSTDFYTFKIKETKTAGEQYVNVLEGYEIVVRVHVEPDGTLTLVNKNGEKYAADAKVKYTIQSTAGKEVVTTSDLYNYVKVEITNNSISALIDNTGKLNVEVTNPVRYNVNLNTLDTKGQSLPNTKLTVLRAKTQMFNGVVNNDVNSDPEIAEGPMSSGIYTYYITENETAGSKYVNVLDGRYIKLVLKVDGNGKVTLLDANGNENSDYLEVYKGNINDTDKSKHTEITDANILKYLSVKPRSANNVYTIDVNVVNPVKYQVDIVTKDTLDNFLTDTKVVAYRGSDKLFDNVATNKDVTGKTEIFENYMDANTYTYYITQTGTKAENYVNVLEGKFLKVNVALEPNGSLRLYTIELYKGNIGDANAELIPREQTSVFDYLDVKVLPAQDIDTLQVTIKNPVEFRVEVDTVDSGDKKDENGNPIKSPLGNTNIEISSPIIKEQNGKYSNEKISGVTNISKEGIVNGTTTDVVDNGLKSRVSYEETWVNANKSETQYYEYVIKETKTAGNQYVNILDGYKVIVRVHVDADGRLTLVDADGKAYAQNEKYKFEIVSETDAEVPESVYTYVDVVVNNGKVKAVFNAQIENPVRYNVAIHETIYGEEQIPLQGMPMEISGFTPKTTVVTGEDGSVSIEESPVRADTYEYIFTQLDEYVNSLGKTVEVEDEFVNILDGYYIGVDLRVHADGVIKSINADGDETTTYYTLYKRDENGEFKPINFNDTIVDDFVKVKITEGEGEQDDVYTLNVYVQIPEKYNFSIAKTDIDTKENLNDVEFSVTVTDENGEVVLKDATSGKDAKDSFETINTKELKTATIKNIDGIIEVNNILIEKAGTYNFIITETTPKVEGLIYKDKSEPIVAKVDIVVENGKYVVKNMEITQAKRYTIDENTFISGNETNTINVNVLNERIKGSYDLITTTINKFNEQLLDGGIYKIIVKDDEGERVLYLEDGNVLSQNPLLPYEGDIEGDIEGTSILAKEDIRIDLPRTYTITIEEIKSPENFIKLDDVIEFTVTTGIAGEFDDAKYVLKEVKLKEANHGLVSLTNTEDKIDVVVRKEYFDLSLRQYITSVNGKEIKDRIPSVVLDEFNKSNTTTAEYIHKKEAQRAYAGNEIIYTIEVYNEGLVDGYAQEIVQYIPEGLEFVDDEFNKEQGWQYIAKENKAINTKLAKQDMGANSEEDKNLIKAYDKETSTISSKKIQLKLKVMENVKVKAKLTTIAEITKVLVEDRKETLERDSKELVKLPEGEALSNYKDEQLENAYIPGNEDDDDFEKLVIEEFDFAAVKYLKQVNTEVIEENIPELSLDNSRLEEYKAGIYTGFKYKTDSEMPELQQNDVVVYGIRVYNEGTIPGYASEVKDNLPDGLKLKLDSEINKKYGWVMIDEEGNVTDDSQKACCVVTNYLSKEVEDAKNAEIKENTADVNNVGEVENLEDTVKEENSKEDNLLLGKVVENGKVTIDYRDIEIEFTVVEPSSKDRIIENIAEVSKFNDDLGLEPKDIDPEERLNENHQEIYVKSFDLELLQRINSIVVTDKNGKVIADMNATNNKAIEDFAKVDIPKTELEGSNIKVEYIISVKNNGETSGYAMEIKDYIPSGFKFVQEDNKDWEVINGVLVTDVLAGELLEPDETKEVNLVLVWDDHTNIGNKENIAEISADLDENKLDVIDIDSTPDNKVAEEDDQDNTELVIAVRTGRTNIVTIIISTLCFISAGACSFYYIRSGKKQI